MKTSSFLDKDWSKIGKQPQFVSARTSSRRLGVLQRNEDFFGWADTPPHTHHPGEAAMGHTAPRLDREGEPKGWSSQRATATSLLQLLRRASAGQALQPLSVHPLSLTSIRHKAKRLRFLGRIPKSIYDGSGLWDVSNDFTVYLTE